MDSSPKAHGLPGANVALRLPRRVQNNPEAAAICTLFAGFGWEVLRPARRKID